MKITDEMILTLGSIVTRDEAGRHFTEVFPCWKELELAGLIDICRPIHRRTGMPYSSEYWTLEVTPNGQAIVDANEDMFSREY